MTRSQKRSLKKSLYLWLLVFSAVKMHLHVTRAEQLIERLIYEITQQAGSGRFQKYQEALHESLGYVETSTYASIMLPHLIKNIKGHDYSIRIWSLYSLRRISRVSASEKIRPYLFEMLCDEDIWIRSAALWGLSHMPGSEITRMLLNVLNNDADALVRKYAAKYLGERRESSPQITKALLDQEQQNDAIGYCSSCDVAYNALWLLVNDGSLEP
jgi:hypothetical protein